MSGPHFGGGRSTTSPDRRADPISVYASQSRGWFGQVIQRSDDGGQTWRPVGNDSPMRERPPPTSGMTGRHIRGSSPAFGISSRPRPIPTRSTPVSKMPHSSSRPTAAPPGRSSLDFARTPPGRRGSPERGGCASIRSCSIHPIRNESSSRSPRPGCSVPTTAGKVAADQPRPALRGHPRPRRRGGPLCAPLGDAPGAPDVVFMQKHWDVMRSDDAAAPGGRSAETCQVTSVFPSQSMRTNRTPSMWCRSK